jgi:hypothetical protein
MVHPCSLIGSLLAIDPVSLYLHATVKQISSQHAYRDPGIPACLAE